ncbi:MAG: histidine kinase [Bacteroidota bacterium]
MNEPLLKYLYLLAIVLALGACSSNSRELASEAARFVSVSSHFPDSTIQRLEELGSNFRQTIYLLALCREWHSKMPQAALEAALKVEEMSRRQKSGVSYAQALYWKSYILNQEDPQNVKLKQALADVRISIEIFQKQSDPIWLARSLNLRASIHYNLYEETKGAVYNKEAQEILRLAGLDEKKQAGDWGDIYRTAGNIELFTSKNTDTVLYYFDLSRDCYARIPDSNRLARLFTNYAIVYDWRKESSKADSTFRQSIELYKQLGNVEHLAEVYLDYATFHASRFKTKKEVEWLDSSNTWLAKAEQLQPSNKAEIYFQYGANLHNKALYIPEFERLYFDSASVYYERVLSIGVAEKNTRYVEMVSMQLAKLCSQIGTSACRDLLTKASLAYQAISDSTTQAIQQASRIMEKFREEESKQSIRQIYIIGLILILGLIILFVIPLQSSKIKLLLARMEALRSQMNPHFISNSLNAIDLLIHQDRNEEASEYIIDFSRLCRLILNNSKKNLISLEKELETLGYYLSLEKLRMRKKLEYTIEIDPDIDQKKTMIPPMLLQPFIENAIIHGIQNKQAPGHLLLSISTPTDQLMECIVEDDGVGRQKAKALQKESVLDRTSWGIHITQERIDALKRTKGTKINIIDLKDANGLATGTRIIIRCPIIHQTENPLGV